MLKRLTRLLLRRIARWAEFHTIYVKVDLDDDTRMELTRGFVKLLCRREEIVSLEDQFNIEVTNAKDR